jgi:NNP family nitrate/nitrite transporter-like MFS transporter
MEKRSKRWIEEWNPDEPVFWEKTGKKIAWRNLVWSILAENIGFSVWLSWSIVATKLKSVGFAYTTSRTRSRCRSSGAGTGRS